MCACECGSLDVCLSACVRACSYVWLTICLPVWSYMYVCPACECLHMSEGGSIIVIRYTRQFKHSSIHPSIRPSIHLSVRPSIHSSIHPSVRPSVCMAEERGSEGYVASGPGSVAGVRIGLWCQLSMFSYKWVNKICMSAPGLALALYAHKRD